MSGALAWGWDATNKVWVPIQVNEDGKLEMASLEDAEISQDTPEDLKHLPHGYYASGPSYLPLAVDSIGRLRVELSSLANLNDIGDVSVASPSDEDIFYYDSGSSLWKPKKLPGANLGQDFGASSARLQNTVISPKEGQVIRISNADMGMTRAVFTAKINGTPTSTSVVYDNDSQEDMFAGLEAYDGTDYWGQIILHNLTRGNSRKIVSVNRTTNTITTAASSDDWANNDDITVQSQVNTDSGAFDIDLSDKVAATDATIFFYVALVDNSGVDNSLRMVLIHPYESYNNAKQMGLLSVLANQGSTIIMPVKVVDQKITLRMVEGCEDVFIDCRVIGTCEYADT